MCSTENNVAVKLLTLITYADKPRCNQEKGMLIMDELTTATKPIWGGGSGAIFTDFLPKGN
jgi:hypothetical protein